LKNCPGQRSSQISELEEIGLLPKNDKEYQSNYKKSIEINPDNLDVVIIKLQLDVEKRYLFKRTLLKKLVDFGWGKA